MFKSQIGGLALNRRKCSEMGPEWSPGPENRPPGMPRPFSRLWDRSLGPGRPQVGPSWLRVGPESAEDTCGMTAIIPQAWDDGPVRPDLSSHLKQRYAHRIRGQPKPGAAYESQPDGAAGGPPGGRWGPTGPGGPVGTPWRAQGVRTSIVHQYGTRRMTTCSELRWKAHFFFWAKTDMPNN